MLITRTCMACFFIIALSHPTYAEFFVSLSGMEPLLDTHKTIVDNLQDYIDEEQNRHNILRKHLEVFKEEQKKAMADVTNYLENPVSLFTLMKRLAVDLDVIEQTIKSTSEYKIYPTINYPTSEDLFSAAQALTLLCDIYNLNVTDLANGILNGVFSKENKVYTETITPMSISDCLVLGSTMYQYEDYKNGLSWIIEAYNKYKAEIHENHPFEKADIIEQIRFAYDKLNDFKAALKWTKKLVALRPSAFYDDLLKKYEVTLAMEDKEIRVNGVKDVEASRRDARRNKVVLTDTKHQLPEDERVIENYKTLCKGQAELSKHISKRLKCRYRTENHPFLKLAPIKIEQVYLEPEVILAYEMISDREIEHIKQIAKTKLRRAWVAEGLSAPYRISETAWLADEESNVVKRLTQRVSDLTGLSLEWTEKLQVNNYGIGGHFAPHYDNKNNTLERLATVMFYMSDVAQGGATVFTELGLTVFPVRGAALFWRNILPSGERDRAVIHSGCPVLRGDKWVANKWIDHHQILEHIASCNQIFEKGGYTHQIPPTKL